MTVSVLKQRKSMQMPIKTRVVLFSLHAQFYFAHTLENYNFLLISYRSFVHYRAKRVHRPAGGGNVFLQPTLAVAV